MTTHTHRCPECRQYPECGCDRHIGEGEDRTCAPCADVLGEIRTWLHPRLKLEFIAEVRDRKGEVFKDCWQVLREEECNCPDAGFDEDHPEHWNSVGYIHLTVEQAVLALRGQLKWIPTWR